MHHRYLLVLVSIIALIANINSHADIRISLPQGRTAFQTNERIDIAVQMTGSEIESVSPLELEASCIGAPTLHAEFHLSSLQKRATEYLRLNASDLRPGSYRITIRQGTASATASVEVRSHIRRSSFRLIDWGSKAEGADIRKLGEDGLGFNTLYSNAAGDDSILGGLDFMGCCVMSGGHQMDLRQECDWSDPYVILGGARRASRAALRFRREPNAIGVHFYDEPGLTWSKDPRSGEFTPHTVPSQQSAYQAAYGAPPPDYRALPGSDKLKDEWKSWAEWKLGFMDAAWRLARFGVDAVSPEMLSVTQSQYGWNAFTDGYYTNVTRSLPLASGHGGYDDYGLGVLNPMFFLEMGRARDLSRPCWYLPTWYGNTPADRYRLEQYSCFMTGLQGMAKPPDMQVHKAGSSSAEPAIVETNRVMGRIGTIFENMEPTRPPVALLYSFSNMVHEQISDPKICYVHETKHGQALPIAYLAGQVMQRPFMPVVEEEVRNGTLRSHFRAVVLAGLDYIAPETISALEEFAASGGVVVETADTSVVVRGALRVKARAEMPDAAEVARLLAIKDYTKIKPYVTIAKYQQSAVRLGTDIASALARTSIPAECVTDNRSIIARRQKSSEIEYLFLVNAASAPTAADPLGLAPTSASIRITTGGRPLYDALASAPAVDMKSRAGFAEGSLKFQPGQMRVFAVTVRPIAGVRITAPEIKQDTDLHVPTMLNFTAYLADDQGEPITGAAPMELRLLSPSGEERYRLNRATREGFCRFELPLAANDAPGAWKVIVRELLSGKQSTRTVEYHPAGRKGDLAGMVRRALVFEGDREPIYRFVRNHRAVTIAAGSSSWCKVQAERLAAILKPWGIIATITDALKLNHARKLSEEEAKTWCGIDYAPGGAIKPGDGNLPGLVGYDLTGPIILLGSPTDNPLIAELERQNVLSYKLSAAVPAPGRGYISWERDVLASEIETVSLIARDEAGLSEAVGSFYEITCGLGMVDEMILPWEACPVNSSK